MFSKKMYELGSRSSKIREIFEYGKKRKEEIGAENVFDFSLGNPSIPTPTEFTDELLSLIRNTKPCELHGYTSAAGDFEAREAIAKSIENEFGTKQDPSLIYMTCGAAASLTISLKAILKKGDEVIVLAPYFPEYKVFVEGAGGKLVEVATKDKTFVPDIQAIKKRINRKTRAIIINSPNNPTGVVYSKQDVCALSELLKQKEKKLCRDIFIISDEPYRALVYDGGTAPYIPNYYDNCIVCTSFSKSLSLPGERIGYIAVSPSTRNKTELFYAISGAARTMGYVCAPSLFQKAVAKHPELHCELSLYDKNRQALYTSLTNIGYECTHPDGAFYLFVKALEDNAEHFCEKAREFELLLVPSDSFGKKGYVRISYCVDFDSITKSIPAFEKLYNTYKETEK